MTETFDPETIRRQLAKASEKFASIRYNVKELNQWVKTQMLHLQSHGQDSTDVHSHLWGAYKSSNDKEFVTYIQGLEDQVQDGAMHITWKELMKKAQSKVERLHVQRNLKSSSDSGTDDVKILRTQLETLQSELHALQVNVPTSNGGGNGGGNPSRREGGRTNNRRRYEPPAELKNEPKPSDPNKTVTVNGKTFKWCDNHKWCAHITSECRDLSSGGNGKGGGDSKPATPDLGDRNGRAIKAYNTLIGRHKTDG